MRPVSLQIPSQKESCLSNWSLDYAQLRLRDDTFGRRGKKKKRRKERKEKKKGNAVPRFRKSVRGKNGGLSYLPDPLYYAF